MNKKLISLLAAVVVVAPACTDALDADDATREDGEVVEAGDVGALSLQIGDCFDDDAQGEVQSVPVVPCDEEHTGEVFHLFDLDDGEFPGGEAIDAAVADRCLARFDDYVGREYATSRFLIGSITPTVETWDNLDDREVVCTLFDVNGEQLTSTARDSGE